MLALIRNENTKLWKRKTVWVMLILLVVASLGLSALMGLVEMLDSEDSLIGWKLEDYCNSELEYYERLKNDPSFSDERTEYDIEWNLAYFTFLKEIGATWDDWRYTQNVADDMVTARLEGDSARADRIEAFLRANDYLAFYDLRIADNALQFSDTGLLTITNYPYQYCKDHDLSPDDWQFATATSVSNVMMKIRSLESNRDAGIEINESELDSLNDQKALLVYRLDHNVRVNPADSFGSSFAASLTEGLFGIIEPVETSSFWDSLKSISGLVTLVGLFTIIMAGSIVASEFQKGTVKFLLMVPAKRWKILLSKYLSVLLNGLFMMAILYVTSVVFGLLFFGAGDLLLPSLSVKNGVVTAGSPFLLLLWEYLLEGAEVFVMMTLAFAISSLLHSSAAAIGVSMLAYMGGSLITSFLALLGLDWGRYLIFANMDIASIRSGATLFPHQSLPLAIVIVVLHLIVFFLTAFDGFTRREV